MNLRHPRHLRLKNHTDKLSFKAMNRIMNRCFVALLALALLPGAVSAQDRRDKEQTYVMEYPYEVTKITPPQGKKVKNVILMIGDGMSLMHVYSAWTANRGKLFLTDNCQAVGLSKTYCANRLITDSEQVAQPWPSDRKPTITLSAWTRWAILSPP